MNDRFFFSYTLIANCAIFLVDNLNYPNQARKFKKLIKFNMPFEFSENIFFTDFITIFLEVPLFTRHIQQYRFFILQFGSSAL